MEKLDYDHSGIQLGSDNCVSGLFPTSFQDRINENSLGPMVTPALPIIAMKYNVSLDMAASLIIGFLAFWIGFTTFFTASGANIWGKRPFFMISSVILLATNVWGFFASV